MLPMPISPSAAVCGLPMESDPVLAFVRDAQRMLDPATPESVRIELEHVLHARIPVLRAHGVFELMQPRSPVLRAWLEDELELLGEPAAMSSWHG